MANCKCNSQQSGDPSAPYDPGDEENGREEQSLQRKDRVRVEKDGPESQSAQHLVEKGQGELLVDVEAMEDVDGSQMLRNVISLELFNAFS